MEQLAESATSDDQKIARRYPDLPRVRSQRHPDYIQAHTYAIRIFSSALNSWNSILNGSVQLLVVHAPNFAQGLSMKVRNYNLCQSV